MGGDSAMLIRISNKYGTWDNAITGKGFFAKRLISAIKRLGIDVITDTEPPVDVDLQFGKYTYAPNARKSVVRMGPVYVGKNNHEANSPKKKAITRADAVIYQSKFCKKMADAFIGESKNKNTIIYNGAEPSEYRAKPKTGASFVASTRVWTPQKRLKDIVRSFLRADIPDSILTILGTVEKEYKGNNVFYPGVISWPAVEYLTNFVYDVMVSIVWLDAMPNSVCEGLVAGCNVITTSASGTAEIAPDLVLKEPPWDFKQTNKDKPPKIDRNALAELMRKSVKAPKPKTEHVNINTIAKQYVSFFEELL